MRQHLAIAEIQLQSCDGRRCKRAFRRIACFGAAQQRNALPFTQKDCIGNRATGNQLSRLHGHVVHCQCQYGLAACNRLAQAGVILRINACKQARRDDRDDLRRLSPPDPEDIP